MEIAAVTSSAVSLDAGISFLTQDNGQKPELISFIYPALLSF
jgi:hypothetical protein